MPISSAENLPGFYSYHLTNRSFLGCPVFLYCLQEAIECESTKARTKYWLTFPGTSDFSAEVVRDLSSWQCFCNFSFITNLGKRPGRGKRVI